MLEKESIKIALAEDNVISRKSFLDRARLIPEWKIIFVASNGKDCMEKLEQLTEEQMPDLIFMDIEMPGINGISTISMAKALYPQLFFIAFTVFDDDEKIFEARA